MLDYFGSITKPPEDVDKELIETFKNKAPEETLKIIISDLKNKKVITEYSITGWNMYAKKQLCDIIVIELNNRLQANNKKLKATYCLKNYLNDDVIYKIFNK
uniref:Uncharacterized protein n=1 Tax=viral metagenome TaxID=1070528 RepID=A0A6C0CY57_9ZZZZ